MQRIWAKWGGNAAGASKKSPGTELGRGVLREGCAGRNCREYSFSCSSWNIFCFSHVTVNPDLQHLSPGFKTQRCGQSVQSVQTSTNAADCKKSWKMLKQAVSLCSMSDSVCSYTAGINVIKCMASLIDTKLYQCLALIKFTLPDEHAQAWHEQIWSHGLILSIQHLRLLLRVQLPIGNLPKQVSVLKLKLQDGVYM